MLVVLSKERSMIVQIVIKIMKKKNEKKYCQVFNFTRSFGSSFGQVILVKKKKKIKKCTKASLVMAEWYLKY